MQTAIFGICASPFTIRFDEIAFPYGIHFANNLFGAVVVVSADDVFRGSPGIFLSNSLT